MYPTHSNLQQRRTRADVDGKLSTLRTQLKGHQTMLFDLITAMLKAGGQLRAKTVQWIAESLALNIEAEKERPNPQIKSSDAFLINLGAVLLSCSSNFILDPKKRASFNDAYIQTPAANHGAYPAELTFLKPPQEGDMAVDNAGGGGGGDAATTTEFSFLTQAFFLGWRALHLGLVQCFSRRKMLDRHLGHYQVRKKGVLGWWRRE